MFLECFLKEVLDEGLIKLKELDCLLVDLGCVEKFRVRNLFSD